MNAMSLFERSKSYKKYRYAYKNDRKGALAYVLTIIAGTDTIHFFKASTKIVRV